MGRPQTYSRAYDEGSAAVRAQVERYLDRTGLTHGDFARRIGYSVAAMHLFMQERYKGSLDNICGAAKEFMALHPIASATQQQGRLYETANVRAWREIFYECLDRGRAAVVYGPPGIQKSFPVESLIAELNANNLAEGKKRAYYIYCRQSITPAQLLKRVAEACGTSPLGYADRVLRNLKFDFGNARVLLVFDEAQHLSIDCLETVRELLDRLGCGLIFSGSHDLFRVFSRSIDLEQWNRRLRHAVALPGMTEEDARRIIAGELGNLKEKTIAELIANSRVKDARKKDEIYISAGRLFACIEQVKEEASRIREGAGRGEGSVQ